VPETTSPLTRNAPFVPFAPGSTGAMEIADWVGCHGPLFEADCAPVTAGKAAQAAQKTNRLTFSGHFRMKE
jgi:hypothetical protein